MMSKLKPLSTRAAKFSFANPRSARSARSVSDGRQPGGADPSVRRTSSLSACWGSTPGSFRTAVLAALAVVVLCYACIVAEVGSIGLLLHQPGFVLLAGLVLLADLYPLVPSMREVRSSNTFAWSVALSLAAVLAYGPAAALLFLLSGITAALPRRSDRWCNLAVSVVIFGATGLAVAALSHGADVVVAGLLTEGAWRLTLLGLLLAGVVVVVHPLLVGVAATARGRSSWTEQRRRVGKSLRIWGASLLTAPLLATLALEGPWALPSMAVVIVALNQVSRTMVRSTEASRTDGLTGIANRSALSRVLADRVAAIQPGRLVTVLLIDLDRFKDVNDTYGHVVGDQVLVAVAHRLQAAAAGADLVARYGGDEFAVVLTTADDSGPVDPGPVSAELVGAEPVGAELVGAEPVGPGPAHSGAEAPAAVTGAIAGIREALGIAVSAGDVRVVVGCSIGIGQTRDPAADVLELLAVADQEMYRAKRGGHVGSHGLLRSARPRIEPIWSTTVQGGAVLPAAAWLGVQWSASSWLGPGSTPVVGGAAVWAATPPPGNPG